VSGVREGLVASASRLFEGWERTDEGGGWAEGLWAWRDEFGAESEWGELLGGIVAGCGPENLWPILTAQPPALG
jgi:hypothetical protein